MHNTYSCPALNDSLRHLNYTRSSLVAYTPQFLRVYTDKNIKVLKSGERGGQMLAEIRVYSFELFSLFWCQELTPEVCSSTLVTSWLCVILDKTWSLCCSTCISQTLLIGTSRSVHAHQTNGDCDQANGKIYSPLTSRPEGFWVPWWAPWILSRFLWHYTFKGEFTLRSMTGIMKHYYAIRTRQWRMHFLYVSTIPLEYDIQLNYTGLSVPLSAHPYSTHGTATGNWWRGRQ
jgi:hypothetical protein